METSTMQKEVDDIPKILEQEIFTQGVLGYCSHFSIPNKNNYNINFPHFADFESLYLKEKYLKQFFDKNSPIRDPKIHLPLEASTSLNQVLIAKNNYQRVMLQMLDTIYHQEQKIKSQAFFLQFHNTYTSRIEKEINDLKNIITCLIPEVSTAIATKSFPSASSLTISKKLSGDQISTKELAQRLRKIKNENKTSIHYSFQETPFVMQTQENPLTTSPDFKLNLSSMPPHNTSNKGLGSGSVSQREPSKRFNSRTENSTPISRGTTSMWDPHSLKNKHRITPPKENNKVKKSSSYMARRSSETSQSINEDLTSQNQSVRFRSKDQKYHGGSQSHRNSLHDITEDKTKRSYLKSARNRSRDNSEYGASMENNSSSRDILYKKPPPPKKSLIISSGPEDCDIYKDAASKKKRGVFESGGLLKAILNNKNMKYNDAEIHSNLEKISKIQNHKNLTTSMHNKDISFQSSTSNLFEAIEITTSIIREEPEEKAANNNNNKSSFYHRNQSKERTEKDWPMNPVASPNFGAHSNLTERSLNRASSGDRNPSKMTPTKSSERKENEPNILGKIYCGALLKKKKWTPLLAKKN